MKRETSLKTGDLIPQNHILYYVVDKPYEIST